MPRHNQSLRGLKEISFKQAEMYNLNSYLRKYQISEAFDGYLISNGHSRGLVPVFPLDVLKFGESTNKHTCDVPKFGESTI